MKKSITVFTAILLLILFSQINYSQNKNSNLVRQSEVYVEKIKAETKNRKEPDLIFADTSQNNKSKWRKFASSKILKLFREKSETYSISNNWLKNKKIIISIFTIFSESGDWANYIYYYFRQDGTLAKLESEYRTFHGNFAAIKDVYFDSKGRVLKRNTKYVDLDNKSKKPDKDYLSENSPMMNDFVYYKTTNKLPFYHLLKSKK